ncbi:TetR-like C-terminal domain-containing protein [Streptomyces sp. SP17KL33]|uniref:TetR-like C-terminal domain-containing protein n=1 Tax=Streptomyces sp. SP17KL33 TaxID=3002534 RepID=UPI002E768042|nr:TetR-like C-terminal domain-containing protein [Streptomyces sp. SP17KL33]MEE1837220.1 TetR-like C-terminal domain-containing protein [Streptomyces sp. SP17KL33]
MPVVIGPGRLREELVATMTRALWSQNTSRVDLLTALHDTARQEPELCGLVRQRYVGSLHQSIEGVLAHAVERGDLPPRQADPSGGHSIAVSAALALLLHWGLVRGRQVSDDDIAAIVDAVLMPLL